MGIGLIYQNRGKMAGNPVTTAIRVRVQPRASRNEVVGYVGDTLGVRVTAAPEAGRANRAVVELLAEVLGVSPSRVRIVRGQGSRLKLVRVEGLAEDEVRGCLEGLG